MSNNFSSLGLSVESLLKKTGNIASGLVTGIFNNSDKTELELVNTVSIPVINIQNISIKYIAENINFIKTQGKALVVKEYMNQNSKELFAEIKQTQNTITINNGIRKGISLRSFIEVHIPESWSSKLNISTIGGNILSDDDWMLKKVKIKSVGGNLEFNSITAKEIILSSSNGNVTADLLQGKISIQTVIGLINIYGIAGYGEVNSNSGNMKLYFDNLTDSLKMKSGSGNIYLHMADNNSCEYEITTTLGEIKSSFDNLIIKRNHDKRIGHGFIGESNYKEVKVDSLRGNIHISN